MMKTLAISLLTLFCLISFLFLWALDRQLEKVRRENRLLKKLFLNSLIGSAEDLAETLDEIDRHQIGH